MILELFEDLTKHLEQNIEDADNIFEEKSIESIDAGSYPALNILVGDEDLTEMTGGNNNQVYRSDIIFQIQVLTSRDEFKQNLAISDAVKIALVDFRSHQGQIQQSVATDVTDDRMVRTITTIMTTRHSKNENNETS